MTAVNVLALLLTASPVLLIGYAYVGYPALLWLLALVRPRRAPGADPVTWPTITITLPCYNEAARLRSALEHILAADYPADRRQIIVISDASTDATDDIAREYAAQGVELLRMPDRRGKTAAENAAGRMARGDILINTDASVRLLPHSIKPLVRAFEDAGVGVASGRDVSTGDAAASETHAEAGYVGYEMWVRSLETRLGSIVGSSGCFFGIRRSLHDPSFPEGLSRDFASALIAREHGLRAVSVDEALCVVPRTSSLRAEVQRKVRTMARGMETLWFKRHLMNPLSQGLFALMLISHKLCRWLVYALLPASAVGLLVLGVSYPWARLLVAAIVAGIALGAIGMRWPGERPPRLVGFCTFALATQMAGVLAWYKVLRGDHTPTWEPTRRPA